jgi:DNA-binding transcriptional regulator YhcF (GntR family)
MPVNITQIRRSMLRESILRELEKGPVRTVTALAATVQLPRPSVSRKLQEMREAGEVERTSTGWILTEHGRAITEKARADREAQMTRAMQSFGRSVDGMLGTLRSPLVATSELTLFGEASAFAQSLRQLPDLIQGAHRAQIDLATRLQPMIVPAIAQHRQMLSQMESIFEVVGSANAFAGVASAVETTLALGAGSAINDSINQMSRSMVDTTRFYASIAESATRAFRSISSSASISFGTLFQQPGLGDFYRRLPELAQQVQRLAQARVGAEALEEAGFEYTNEIWAMAFLIELSTVDPTNRPAEVKSRLKAFTEDEDFSPQLEELFRADPALNRRWPVVNEAIQAHQRGHYYTSIATLIPQVEGVLNDILTRKGFVLAKQNKYYTKTDRGVEGKYLSGLTTKYELAARKQAIGDALAAHFATLLVPERDPILHGTKVDYGAADLSVHALLTLLVIAWTLTEIESENALNGDPVSPQA